MEGPLVSAQVELLPLAGLHTGRAVLSGRAPQLHSGEALRCALMSFLS